MIIGKNLETLFSAVRDAINRLVNGKQAIGSQTIDMVSTNVYSLTVPTGATEVLIMFEKATAVSSDPYTAVVRWSVTSTAPEAGAYTYSAGPPVNPTDGMPWASMTPLILKGADSLNNFKCVAVSSPTIGTLGMKVIYFK